jgi:translocation and assembly module TamB
MPLDRMNLAGSAGGTVAATWEGSPADLVVDLALNSTPPDKVSEEQLPVTAQLQGRYFARRLLLQLGSFEMSTRNSHLNASGDIGYYSSNLKFNLASTDVSEFQPAFDNIAGIQEIPVTLSGHATFAGTLTGPLNKPEIAGHLQATDFDTLLKTGRKLTLTKSQAPAPPPEGKQQVHWDSLSADIQYSPSFVAARRGSLQRGKTHFAFDVSAGLKNGVMADASPISLKLKVANGELADLQAIAGYSYPVSGNVELALQLAGTEAQPEGTGNILLTHAVLFGQPVTSLRSDIQFVNGEARLSNISVAQSDARLRGHAAYNLHTTAFDFNLEGTNFDLTKIVRLQTSRLSTAGKLDFTVQGSGTTHSPVFNAKIHMRQLVLNGEDVGEFNVDAVTHGADMQLTGRSNFQHSQLAVDGTVHLRRDWPAALTLRLDHLDVDPLFRAYLRGRVTGHSSVAGVLAFRGPLKNPDHWNVVGDIDELSADIQNIKTHNDGPIHFVENERVLTLDRLRIIGEGTDVTAGGTMQFFGNYDMNMHADGRINLRLIETLNPDFTSSGHLNVHIGVTGTWHNPVMNGQLSIQQGALSYVDVPSGLSDVNGTLVFTQDRLEVQSLTAHTGGGTVSLGGYVNYGRRVNFHVTALGNDIRLRYPPGMSATANADLRLTGSLSNAVLAGDITVTRFGVSPDFDFATYLVRARESITAPNPKSLLNNLHFDVHIVTTPELQVQTSIAKASGDADLRLRGTGTHPSLLGRVNILEGEVSFNATKFELSRGDISFVNPVEIQPVLDLEATTRVRDYDISIGFHGPLDKMSTTYRSDPPLTTQDIIALLAFGRTREDTALQPQNIPTFDQAASNAILSQALNSATNNRVQKLFGVSRVKIDPQVGATENNPSGARLTIEQQVSGDITLTYITNVAQTSQQIIQAEYNVNRYVSLIAIRDQNGVVSFDVRIRQRKK